MNQNRMKKDWMKTEIKVDLCYWGFKTLILKEKCVKYLHNL